MNSRSTLIVCSLLLAACEPQINVEIVATPLDSDSDVTLRLDGVDLQRLDSGTESLTRNRTGEYLIAGGTATPLPADLLSNSDIESGEYTGLLLRLADNIGNVSRSGQPSIFIDAGVATFQAADVAFMVDGDRDQNISLVVAMDLALSLSEDNGEFTLDPLIRAMEREDAASLGGNISASRLDGTDCNFTDSIARVYLFKRTGSEPVVPDERDGSNPEPFAVADVLRGGAGTGGTYRLDYLPPGDYTLALTCDGQFENGRRPADENMDFELEGNVRLDAGQDRVLDFET